MITSNDNPKLKLIRRLAGSRSARSRAELFVAEGEDLVDAARVHGWEPAFVLEAGVDVDARLLAAAGSLGSGARCVGVYRERWSQPAGALTVYLHGVGDPGNVGTVIRAAHAFADGPVVLGPACADPFSPKAVRATMGSLFARPPAAAPLASLAGTKVALDARAPALLRDVDADPPVVVCVGGERTGLPDDVLAAATLRARIPLRGDGPESLNAAMAATVALYERTRMAGHA